MPFTHPFIHNFTKNILCAFILGTDIKSPDLVVITELFQGSLLSVLLRSLAYFRIWFPTLTLKLLEENRDRKLIDTDLGNDFLGMIPQV